MVIFNQSIFIGIVLVVFWKVYLIINEKYFIYIKLKNGNSFRFFFTNNKKNSVIENVKSIRGKIIAIDSLNRKHEII